jgi:hypothetical protein
MRQVTRRGLAALGGAGAIALAARLAMGAALGASFDAEADRFGRTSLPGVLAGWRTPGSPSTSWSRPAPSTASIGW